jgi:hypothetical protein
MSKAHFSLSRFQSEVKTQGLARTNRFEVQIAPPGVAKERDLAELSSLFVEVANLPPLNINVKPFKMFGPNHQRPISSDYGGDGLSMTFHLDRSMKLKRFFDDWMESVVNRDAFTVRYQKDYITTITLRQLDEQDDINYELELLEAFPRSMNIVEFNNSAANQTQRLTVVFAYRYWRRTDIEKATEPKIPVSTVAVLPQRQVNAIIPPKTPTNVTYTGIYSPGTTNEDMAFGVGGGII